MSIPGSITRPVPPLMAPTVALLVVALGGRFTLDRAGLPSLSWVDLRVVGLIAALGLVVYDLRRVRRSQDAPARAEGWLVVAGMFFAYQIASALWSPPQARVGRYIVDIVCMGLLVFGLYLNARQGAAVVARRVLWFSWVTAVVFAAGAFAAGGGVQGRFAAFGGGPNVFVRIQVLGLIAGLALLATGRYRWIGWSAPLLVVFAILSGSRGGLVAAMMVGFAAVLLADRRARRLAFVGVVGAIVATLVAYQVWEPARALIADRFVSQTVESGYVSGRPQIWLDTLGLFYSNPMLGAGLDGFYGIIGIATATEYPHNYVLAVAGEGGTIGLALLGLAGALWVATVRRTQRWSVEMLAMVAATAFVSLASLFSGDYYDARMAWCFAAVAAALATERETAPADRPAPPRRARGVETREQRELIR
jgi:O-antigen ligase